MGIGHDRDENIMESGQDLNRARRSPCRWGACRSVEDQDMNEEQNEYISQEQDTLQWNQDKTSIVVNGTACVLSQAAVRGVWRTRTWSRNRTTSIRSWNRGLSDRTRTRTSWNQDKTSIASSRGVMPLNVDSGAGGAGGTVRGAEAAGLAGGAGARGVLERKTRAWTKNRTPYSPHQDLHIVT